MPRSLSDIAFVTRRRRCGPLPRIVKRETRVSLGATAPHLTKNDADGRESFAAVERSMSDRLLGLCVIDRTLMMDLRIIILFRIESPL